MTTLQEAAADFDAAVTRLAAEVWRQWAPVINPALRFAFPPARVVLWGGRPDLDYQLDSDEDAERADRMDARARAHRRARPELRIRLTLDTARATAGLRELDAAMRRMNERMRAWAASPAVQRAGELGRALEAEAAAQAREARYLQARDLRVRLAIDRGRYLEPGRIARVLYGLEELEADVDPLELLLASTDVGVDPEAVLYVLKRLQDAGA